MNIIVLFGLPGSGKTYTAKLFEKYFGYHLYEADIDLPKDMDETLKAQEAVTDDMRDTFFKNIIAHTQILIQTHNKLVISQTFIKEMYRKKFLDAFPMAQFIFVHTPFALREKRLANRKEYPLPVLYARKMNDNFDLPKIKHTTFRNFENGEEILKKQIQDFIKTDGG